MLFLVSERRLYLIRIPGSPFSFNLVVLLTGEHLMKGVLPLFSFDLTSRIEPKLHTPGV